MQAWKKYPALLFCLLLTAAATAQVQPEYVFQQDDTLLKKHYYEQSRKNNQTLIASLGKENQAEYKKIYDERLKTISDLLQTSRSVTSPEANNYLQSVLQSIISVNPGLKDGELRVVFSRDWWPNAYSLGDGTIIINAGLMIFLENEAELVFILCHELSHYYLNHSGKSIKKYVETVNSKEFQDELKRLLKQEYRVNQELEKLTKNLVFDSRLHSRTHEAEADLQAFRFMKKTAYDCHAIKSSLQLLNNIDDTSLYKHIDVEQLFNFPGYPFKKKWIQKATGIFSNLDENDSPLSRKEKDSLKTHPDCTKRILLLSDSLATNTRAGSKYLINETLFNRLKKEFFYEMAEQCFTNDNLSRNLYYSLLLLQANENTPLAVFSVARCLNRIYEYQKEHTLGGSIDKEDRKYPQDYNHLLRMLDRLKLDEIAALNDHFCKLYFPVMKDYPGFMQEMNKIKK